MQQLNHTNDFMHVNHYAVNTLSEIYTLGEFSVAVFHLTGFAMYMDHQASSDVSD